MSLEALMIRDQDVLESPEKDGPAQTPHPPGPAQGL